MADERGGSCELIRCACGCDSMLSPCDRYGRPRRFLPGHNRRLSSPATEAVDRVMRTCDRPLSVSEIVARVMAIAPGAREDTTIRVVSRMCERGQLVRKSRGVYYRSE